MYPSPSPMHHQVIYQADPSTVNAIHAMKAKVHDMAGRYANHMVRVQMVDGTVHEGHILYVRDGILYLSVHGMSGHRHFFNPYYYNTVLPLVLYELLVITLMVT